MHGRNITNITPSSSHSRSSGTGEGHFYFTGNHAYRLFKRMKHMMLTHSQMASPLPARQDHQSNGQGRGRGEGSGSESDWTGTGDDWTGTSSDSVFLNYIRSQHQFNPTRSPGISPSPPPPRSNSSSSSHQEGIYTNLNPSTLNQDNQYCSIDRLHPVAVKSPTLSPTPNRVTPPQPLHSLEALAEDDEYCKMVPNSGIRAAVLMQQKTSPTPNRYPSPAHASRPSLPSPTPVHIPQVLKHGSIGASNSTECRHSH